MLSHLQAQIEALLSWLQNTASYAIVHVFPKKKKCINFAINFIIYRLLCSLWFLYLAWSSGDISTVLNIHIFSWHVIIASDAAFCSQLNRASSLGCDNISVISIITLVLSHSPDWGCYMENICAQIIIENIWYHMIMHFIVQLVSTCGELRPPGIEL